ncbi:MAG TPA: polyprenyl synthetase family protein [Thermomicrobiales bacterium]|jgi:geranylgeranyl diphosphate synthase type I|nr:polyprenyl synthetase family protein [Thermomicrobiales bacterium]
MTVSPTRPDAVLTSSLIDELLQREIDSALSMLDTPDGTLATIARYHFGMIEPDGTPTTAKVRRTSQGKRLRPVVALLACAAAGGDPRRALPVAAAIELLHQFTLIHDDIQDDSPLRRGRPTVYRIWGVNQAINAGDAMHAAATMALYRLADTGVASDVTLRLAADFGRMTVEIVRGQVLDLQFEGRDDVTPDTYLDMISGKTSAIVRYAAEAGARIAGLGDEAVDLFARFGLALGVGFQIQDDMLGIWGASEQTGKAVADDIRRRKQTLPVLLLRSAVDGAERATIDDLFSREEIDEAGVQAVLGLLEAYDIRPLVAARVRSYHDEARDALLAAARSGENPARDQLLAQVEQLASRDR